MLQIISRFFELMVKLLKKSPPEAKCFKNWVSPIEKSEIFFSPLFGPPPLQNELVSPPPFGENFEKVPPFIKGGGHYVIY